MENIALAEELINAFLNRDGRTVYVINPDGSTFTLEQGFMLLTADYSQMPVLMEG